jgi:ankyrin repeat protein
MKRAFLMFSLLCAAQAATVTEPARALWQGAAAGDLAVVKSALEAGADINARSPLGRTALIHAAAKPGNDQVIAALLARGADPNAIADGPPIVKMGYFAPGTTALIEAARLADTANVKALLAGKANVNQVTPHGGTALSFAILHGSNGNARLLLSAGAKVNAPFDDGTTPLIIAAQRNNSEIASLLMERGADVNAADMAGNSVLMWAAYAERPNPMFVRALLEAGADAAHKAKSGETAMEWARNRGATEVVDVLTRHMASGLSETTVRAAAAKAMAPLQTTGPQFFKVSGCISCHHQSLPAMAVKAAKAKSIAVNEELVKQGIKITESFVRPVAPLMAMAPYSMPDAPLSTAYILMGVVAENPESELIKPLAEGLASTQRPDGSWAAMAARPPLMDSDVLATSMAVIALKQSGYAGRGVMQKAAAYLRKSEPANAAEKSTRLWAIAAAGAPTDELAAIAKALLAEQRADGGWAQLDKLESDAYATGLAMVALTEAQAVKVDSEAYRRGMVYLTSTQKADGTWFVKTRAFAVQPLKDSGFPHGRDQWISASATSWAVMALANGLSD